MSPLREVQCTAHGTIQLYSRLLWELAIRKLEITAAPQPYWKVVEVGEEQSVRLNKKKTVDYNSRSISGLVITGVFHNC